MPVFDYACKECGVRFERSTRISDRAEQIVCPNGHHSVQKIYSVPAVIFRGSGWYSKDNSKQKISS